MTTPEQVEAVFREMAASTECIYGVSCVEDQPSSVESWCSFCLMRVAAEAWAERARCVTKTVTLATRKEQP